MRSGKEERMRCVCGFIIDVFGILSTVALNSVIQKHLEVYSVQLQKELVYSCF